MKHRKVVSRSLLSQQEQSGDKDGLADSDGASSEEAHQEKWRHGWDIVCEERKHIPVESRRPMYRSLLSQQEQSGDKDGLADSDAALEERWDRFCVQQRRMKHRKVGNHYMSRSLLSQQEQSGDKDGLADSAGASSEEAHQ